MAIMRYPTEHELFAIADKTGSSVETVLRYLKGEEIDPRREPPLRRALIKLGWQRTMPGLIVDTRDEGDGA